MSESDLGPEVLATIRDEIAADRAAAGKLDDPTARARLLERAAIRAEVAEEEAEAIAEEIAENAAENKETALSVRVPESLSRALKQRARAEHVPVSALVRRLLTDAVHAPPTEPSTKPLTVEQVEEIARRVARETLAG